MNISQEIGRIVKRVDEAFVHYKNVSPSEKPERGKAYLLSKPFFPLLKQRLKLFKKSAAEK